MTTRIGEGTPLDTHLVGEMDDHMRELKAAILELFQIGHYVEDPEDDTIDGQLKFGERVNSPTYASTINIDMDKGTIHVITLTGDATLTFGDPPDDGFGDPVLGFGFVLIVKQDATGGRDITWPASVIWLNGSEPHLADNATDETHYSFYTVDGGTNWYGTCIGYHV